MAPRMPRHSLGWPKIPLNATIYISPKVFTTFSTTPPPTHAPKLAQDTPKKARDGLQDGLQDGPKMAQDTPKIAQDGLKLALAQNPGPKRGVLPLRYKWIAFEKAYQELTNIKR